MSVVKQNSNGSEAREPDGVEKSWMTGQFDDSDEDIGPVQLRIKTIEAQMAMNTKSEEKEEDEDADESDSCDTHQGPDGDEQNQKRDSVTGQLLATDPQSCIRCTEKGLKCTLTYLRRQNELQCSACRRNGMEYCIRLRNSRDGHTPYWGPPWKNPNFITGTVDSLTQEEMEQILEDFYLGQLSYLGGNYLYDVSRQAMTLPPFNGSDLPWEVRDPEWKNKDWRAVLPIRRNSSVDRLARDQVRVKAENRVRKAARAGNSSELAISPAVTSAPSPTVSKALNIDADDDGDDTDRGKDREEFPATSGKGNHYRRRAKHLDDLLGETW